MRCEGSNICERSATEICAKYYGVPLIRGPLAIPARLDAEDFHRYPPITKNNFLIRPIHSAAAQEVEIKTLDKIANKGWVS
ncbi:unnamed protein product [Euphydryas editha]|uniref:Uncharacterized protein n=1 Tax=Euphydryas editha TaxID=104508 RepID=A0AAU9UZY3_EUPED|nr:unnamed protein product [Euphydryas editha]